MREWFRNRARKRRIRTDTNSTISLEGVTFAIAGAFDTIDTIDAEDAKWGLIARGARASASAGKRTEILIAGNLAPSGALKKASALGVPVVGEPELHRLLGSEGLRAVLSGAKKDDDTPARSDLRGRRVALSGALESLTQAQVKTALEGFGAHLLPDGAGRDAH